MKRGEKGMEGDGRGGELKCYRHTDRPSDEAGPRGAFAPKKNTSKLKLFTPCKCIVVDVDPRTTHFHPTPPHFTWTLLGHTSRRLGLDDTFMTYKVIRKCISLKTFLGPLWCLFSL